MTRLPRFQIKLRQGDQSNGGINSCSTPRVATNAKWPDTSLTTWRSHQLNDRPPPAAPYDQWCHGAHQWGKSSWATKSEWKHSRPSPCWFTNNAFQRKKSQYIVPYPVVLDEQCIPNCYYQQRKSHSIRVHCFSTNSRCQMTTSAAKSRKGQDFNVRVKLVIPVCNDCKADVASMAQQAANSTLDLTDILLCCLNDRFHGIGAVYDEACVNRFCSRHPHRCLWHGFVQLGRPLLFKSYLLPGRQQLKGGRVLISINLCFAFRDQDLILVIFTTFQLILFSFGPSCCIISNCFDSCSHCSLLRSSTFGSSITDDMASEQWLDSTTAEDEVTKSTPKVAAVSHWADEQINTPGCT